MHHVLVLPLLQTTTRHFGFSSQTLVFFYSFQNCASHYFPYFLASILFSPLFLLPLFVTRINFLFLSFFFFIIVLQHVILVVSSSSNSFIFLQFSFFFLSPSTLFVASPLPLRNFISFMFTIDFVPLPRPLSRRVCHCKRNTFVMSG